MRGMVQAVGAGVWDLKISKEVYGYWLLLPGFGLFAPASLETKSVLCEVEDYARRHLAMFESVEDLIDRR